ncbi:hypothetical protein E8E11_004880 [Didymella keratinophila]|nr:hypothetical protein E8E11_004880 [Didymella keratinophila]
MEGYNIVLVYSFFAQPAFTRKYGQCDPSGACQITASWQAGLGNAVGCGTIIGAFANGYFCHKFGYRPVLLASLAFICAFIAISFSAPNLPVLLVGQFLCGIPWSVFASMAPAYASEVCPMVLRGYLAVYVNLCWAFGQLISAGVQSAFSGGTSQWSYRISFAIQWIISNVVNPYMLNPTAGDWKGKTGFFWGGCAFLFFIWTFFRLAETKGRSFEEMDILFAKGIRARDFKNHEVNAYADTTTEKSA